MGQCSDVVAVGGLTAEVEEALPDRTEVTGRKHRDHSQISFFFRGERRVEHAFEEQFFPGIVEVVEFQFERKPAQNGRIEVC